MTAEIEKTGGEGVTWPGGRGMRSEEGGGEATNSPGGDRSGDVCCDGLAWSSGLGGDAPMRFIVVGMRRRSCSGERWTLRSLHV
jgi:hypothetical protein